MTGSIGPSYQLVANDIRSRISSGEYAVGSTIPSTRQLMTQHQASSTVVRRAVEQLRAEGILAGHPGKGVYVQATPDKAAEETQDVQALGHEVSQLRDEMRRLADDRAAVARLEVNLMDLYAKLGFDYPRDNEAPEGESGTTAHGNLA